MRLLVSLLLVISSSTTSTALWLSPPLVVNAASSTKPAWRFWGALNKNRGGATLASTAEADTQQQQQQQQCIMGFEEMKQFMKDVFESYGVSKERAETCSEVLIEADRRGIDSHGLGRLKPIYCDRMDKNILYADMPIDIITESPTTALVDGNLGTSRTLYTRIGCNHSELISSLTQYVFASYNRPRIVYRYVPSRKNIVIPKKGGKYAPQNVNANQLWILLSFGTLQDHIACNSPLIKPKSMVRD